VGVSHALVLAAGLGTRLRPLTEVRAKPAIPVAGVPLVRRIVGWLATHEVTDIVLNLHHRPETITAVLGDGSDLSARVRYSWEQPRVLGAAGGPRQALSIVGVETFLLINGDTLSNVDLRALGEAHRKNGPLVTLALVPNTAPDRYGGLRLDDDQQVIGFAPRGRAESTYHFVGVQMVQREAFESLPAGQPAQSIGGVYDALIAARPGSVRGFVSEASFLDIGTVADYWATSWSLIDADDQTDRAVGERVRIDPNARVSRSILWDDVEVSAGCVLEECVVTDRVHVSRGAHYRRTILLRTADGTNRAWPLPV
jgi:NDP-sugar pyrophosphorylase family protein